MQSILSLNTFHYRTPFEVGRKTKAEKKIGMQNVENRKQESELDLAQGRERCAFLCCYTVIIEERVVMEGHKAVSKCTASGIISYASSTSTDTLKLRHHSSSCPHLSQSESYCRDR